MMQQPCHRCGFVSDRPTRFCRQCGAQLFVENEATSATTRQYAPQQPANPYDAPYQSQLAQVQYAPDNRINDQAPDTSRLYYDPAPPNYPNYPAVSTGVAKKSGALKWVLITFICILMVSGAISVMVISAIRANQQAATPSPPSQPPPPPVLGSGLEKYKYPNAEVKRSVDVLGNEIVTMNTSDDIDEVGEYYKKRLGAPTVKDENSDTVIFQIPGPPTILITINKDKSDSDNTQITVLRSKIQLPRMN